MTSKIARLEAVLESPVELSELNGIGNKKIKRLKEKGIKRGQDILHLY